MSTEAIQDKLPYVIDEQVGKLITIGFEDGASGALKQGDEVMLKTTGEVDKRGTGADFPIGVVGVEVNDESEVQVYTHFMATKVCYNAEGSAINAGNYLVPNGITNANGYPEYVLPQIMGLAVVTHVAIEPAGIAETVKVGVLFTPIFLPM